MTDHRPVENVNKFLIIIEFFSQGTAEKGVVEVTNCFCVPHKEHKDQVEAELNYAMDLYDLHHRVNPQENIVGWWATGNKVRSFTYLLARI